TEMNYLITVGEQDFERQKTSLLSLGFSLTEEIEKGQLFEYSRLCDKNDNEKFLTERVMLDNGKFPMISYTIWDKKKYVELKKELKKNKDFKFEGKGDSDGELFYSKNLDIEFVANENEKQYTILIMK
nr:hypothetical protein [Ferruginibacter sp.]